MIELNEKYVLHIPLSKFEDGRLADIDIDDILEDLFIRLNRKGFDAFYITRVESRYRSRAFDEVLITVFAFPGHDPIGIFRKWFTENNDVLAQEALAYEIDGSLIVEDIAKGNMQSAT